MKKIVAVSVCIMMLVVTEAPTEAQDNIATYDVSVYVDDEKVTFDSETGFPFIDEANRTQMPFRVILESIGAKVSWDQDTRSARAEKDGIVVEVPIGERYIIRNTEVIVIDTESLIHEDRTYIPLRAVLEAFGCKVYWNTVLRRVEVETETLPVFSKLPSTYDLRSQRRVTEVRNQRSIGACWAFATLGAIESTLAPGGYYDFSEDHMSLTHGYNLTQDEGGDFQISLAYLSRWSGPIYEYEDPYADGITNEYATAAVHVQEALMLPEKDFAAIKRAIMNYGGVQTSIHIRDIEGHELGDAYNEETSSFYYTGSSQPNHDIVIVGWDDDYAKDNFNTAPSRKGAFICRNSYGTEFGDEGYFYVSYDDVWVGEESIVYSRIDSSDNYDRIYQTDWLGWIGRIGYGKDTAYFSNVYHADYEESLEAVSFYATDRDSTYSVYVVPKFSSVNDFSKMVSVANGTFDYAGYYTVDLKTPVTVTGDYAVVVKITTPDSLFPVAAEFYKDVSWLDSVDIDDGQGYMSTDGHYWESTEDMLQSNVVLKAFTDVIGEIPANADAATQSGTATGTE